ncbi:MAG: hypothetical protein PWQ82_1551 [Thermosediminibacterales bacterium]|nr:hypothetical protein [Thermosediminibacterales bacterium]MDK2835779.1 hypothetical protein [Thermosediminibacterales bacterium]
MGLVLEGGGAKGSYQVGAWKALKELGIEINGVAGTSVGALNGAMIVQGDFEKAYEIWSNITPSSIIKIDDKLFEKIKNLDVTPDNIQIFIKNLKEILKNKGLDISPLRKLISRHIFEDKVRNSGIDFGIVTVSISELKPLELFLEDIPEGKLNDYLIASASLPVFKLEKVDGKLFLDGGFFDNLPINLLVSRGYKDIIAIRLYGMGRNRKVNKKGLNITYINPSDNLGGTLDFTTERAQENLNMGYFDTLRVLKRYKGKKYCIISNYKEDYFLNLLLKIDEKNVMDIANKLGLPESIPYRRLLLEKIIPKLTEILDLENTATYEELVIAVLEKAASQSNIDRYRIYEFDKFFDEVMGNYQPTGAGFSDRLPKILKNKDLVLKAVKPYLVGEILDILIAGMKPKSGGKN